MKTEILIILVLGSSIVGTMLLTVRFGNFFEISNSLLNFSRAFTFTTCDPTAVVINSHLFVISNCPTYISIESTDWDYSHCNISLDERDKIIDGINSAVVSERIFVWGLAYQRFDRMNLSKFIFLSLDPWNCSYKALPNLVFSIPNLPLDVVVNENSLDVYFPNQSKKCSPCRFDANGQKLELLRQLEFENIMIVNSTRIKTINEGTNYAYAINLRENTSIVKILDQNFNTLKQMNSSFGINELAVTSNSSEENSSIGILWQSQAEHIAVFDFSLQPIFTAQLPSYPHAYEIASVHLNVDSQANSFVTSVLLSDDNEKYHVLRYNATGYLNYEIQYDRYRQNDTLTTQSFLIDNREYCLVSHYTTKCTCVKCIAVDAV